ncbi:hypothetical protein RIF29_33115 [Crotalaria pallida]|uniref:Uncharacterized protein n=1 Tax=Crotalaria pallida TaxID=3830 RepID=A0AAN9EAC1_CROPI
MLKSVLSDSIQPLSFIHTLQSAKHHHHHHHLRFQHKKISFQFSLSFSFSLQIAISNFAIVQTEASSFTFYRLNKEKE